MAAAVQTSAREPSDEEMNRQHLHFLGQQFKDPRAEQYVRERLPADAFQLPFTEFNKLASLGFANYELTTMTPIDAIQFINETTARRNRVLDVTSPTDDEDRFGKESNIHAMRIALRHLVANGIDPYKALCLSEDMTPAQRQALDAMLDELRAEVGSTPAAVAARETDQRVQAQATSRRRRIRLAYIILFVLAVLAFVALAFLVGFIWQQTSALGPVDGTNEAVAITAIVLSVLAAVCLATVGTLVWRQPAHTLHRRIFYGAFFLVAVLLGIGAGVALYYVSTDFVTAWGSGLVLAMLGVLAALSSATLTRFYRK